MRVLNLEELKLKISKFISLIVDFLDNITTSINRFICSLDGVSLETNSGIVYIQGSSDDDDMSSSSSSSGRSDDDLPELPRNENDSGDENMNSPDDSDISEAPLLPGSDDLDVVEDALNGDQTAIQELREKYPFHFEDTPVDEAIRDVEEYILGEIRAQEAMERQEMEAAAAEASEQGSSAEASPSNSNEETNSSDEKMEDQPLETKSSSKHARSDSTADLESSEKKKTKTNNDDDDDSNNNPPKGGGSLGGLPPAEGGESSSNQEGSNSSNSMSKFEIVLLNIGMLLEEITKNIFPPF